MMRALLVVAVLGSHLSAGDPGTFTRFAADEVDPVPSIGGEPTLVERLAILEGEVEALRAKPGGPPGLAPPGVPFCTDGPGCDAIGCETGLQNLLGEYPKVRLTGFFQADAILFSQSADNRNALVNGTPLGDIQDGADFRRARLAGTGDAWENVGYMIEFDFAFPGRPTFMDVYLDLREIPVLGTVRVGQWRQPFGMDAVTSVKELLFLERALPFALVPFRQIGIGFFNHAENERATWALSSFRYPTDPFGSNVGDDGGYGLAGRVTWLPVDDGEGRLIHVGGSYSFADPSNDALRYRNQPELFVADSPGALAPVGVPPAVPPFVDTGVLPANDYNLFGVEAAAQYDSVYVQSEVSWVAVDQIAGPTAVFPGAYAQVGWFLTGETRPYNHADGVFGRVSPLRPFDPGGSHGCGAWELAVRWSYLDLNDAGITGNRLTDLTCGLNWYLNRNTKFQFNYVHADLDAPNGSSSADIVAMRGQVDF